MLKKIGIGLGAVLAVLLVVIATRPDSVTVQRSAVMDAQADVPYGLVSDFHAWTQWSPWEAIDPGMKRTYDGPAAGKGAKYAWVGNDAVGEGRMTITEAKPSERVDIKLEFLKPWEATNPTTFTFKPAGDKTTVTWEMNAPSNFMMKAMSLFQTMDEMVGPDFEKGLAKMKTAAEAEQKKRAAEAAKKAEEEAAARKAAAEAAARKAAEDAAAAAAAPPEPAKKK